MPKIISESCELSDTCDSWAVHHTVMHLIHCACVTTDQLFLSDCSDAAN